MAESDLNAKIAEYSSTLNDLDSAGIGKAQDTQILSALLARDKIRRALGNDIDITEEQLIELAKVDTDLRAVLLVTPLPADFQSWRDSVLPDDADWWWYSDTEETYLPTTFSLLINTLTIIIFTLALALFVDTAQRFLEGDTDTYGTLAVLFQAGLVVLTGGMLTKRGRQILENTFTKASIPPGQWKWWQLIGSLLLLLTFLVLYDMLPFFAERYNNAALNRRKAGEFTEALADLQRAINLNPNDALYHYNIGNLYEDIYDFDSAKKEYRIAVEGGFDAAYNNLGRLLILEEEQQTAIPLLTEGLDRAPPADTESRYDFHKNLGWARLELGHYDQAKYELETAIAMQPKKAPAYCLLAQLLEAQANEIEDETKSQEHRDSATPFWEQCLENGNSLTPDMAVWIQIAKDRLLEKASR